MSSDLKVDAEINFSPTRFQQGLSQADASLKKTGQTGALAFRKIIDSVDQTQGPLSNFKTNTERAAESTKKMGDAAKNSTVALLGMTQQMTSALSTASGLEKQLIGLQQIKLDIARSTEDAARKEREINKARKEGNLTAEQLLDKEKDLLFVREDITIKTKQLAAEQNSLNINYANMALQLGSTVIFAVTGLSTALKGQSVAMMAASVSTKAMTAATWLATGAMSALRVAMTLVAAHPLIAVALAAATIAIAAYENNWLSLRDTLSDFAGVELPTITQGLDTLGKSVLPTASAETMALDERLAALNESAMMTTETVTGYDLILGKTVVTTDDLNESTKKMGSNIAQVPDWYKKATGSVKVYNQALLDAQRAQDALFAKAGQSIQDFKKKAKVDRESTNRIISGQGGFFITEDGRAISADVDRGPNISGSLAPSGGLLASALRTKKKSRLGNSLTGKSLSRGSSVRIGGRTFSSKGRDRNPFGRHDKLSIKLDERFAKEYPPEKRDFMRIMGFPFKLPQFRRFGDNSPLGRAERTNILVRNAEQQVKRQFASAESKFKRVLATHNLTNDGFDFEDFKEFGVDDFKSFEEVARDLGQISVASENFGFNDDLKKEAFGEFRQFDTGLQAARFVGRRNVIRKNLDKLSNDAKSLFPLHGPDKGRNARILADQLSFMNVERFAAVGT